MQKCNATSKFQFTPLREGRHDNRKRNAQHGDFNSRPSARGDLPFRVLFSCLLYFNSRPSARGDSPRIRTAASTRNFNSRPSARGDVTPASAATHSPAFQFTPLREGRPGLAGLCGHVRALFQFTPLREGRRRCRPAQSTTQHFNSRPSARGDRIERTA